jgi:N,N-dimethylformamidase
LGYTDRLSVLGGERIRAMVSCEAPEYEVDVVRLLHGDVDPDGPGLKTRAIEAGIPSPLPGRVQPIRAGSAVIVEDDQRIAGLASFSLVAAVVPTMVGGPEQAIAAKWSPGKGGFAVTLDETGRLALLLADATGEIARIVDDVPIHDREWSLIGAGYDAEEGVAFIFRRQFRSWPVDPPPTWKSAPLSLTPELANELPLVFGGWGDLGSEDGLGGHFNGKISGPWLTSEVLRESQFDQLSSEPPDGVPVVGRWHFGRDVTGTHVPDISGHDLDGRTVNQPMRGVTGPTWTGQAIHFRERPDEYNAIHFHDDDLGDAGWSVDFEWTIPSDLPTGVYAFHLQIEDADDYLPFVVRPAVGKPQAQIALLLPVYSYLAYSNEHYMAAATRPQALWTMDFSFEDDLANATPYEQSIFNYICENRLLSLYDRHSDGCGAIYSSRLRPTLTIRPRYNKESLRFQSPHQFNEDLYMVDWLETKGFAVDIFTDEDLHRDGLDLLKSYACVITGSHPEYTTEPMWDALDGYLSGGGRLMYLGGNGFFWLTGVDPERPYLIEVRRGQTISPHTRSEFGELDLTTTSRPGGLWRHLGRAPQRLVGVGFTGQGNDYASPYRRTAESRDPRVAWIFDGVTNEILGDYGLHMGGAAGFELDRIEPSLGSPRHTLRLASSFGHSDAYQHTLEDQLEESGNQGGTVNPLVRADMAYFECPNEGAVFSVGSISWMGSLSHNGYDNDISRITENVLRRFSEQESSA